MKAFFAIAVAAAASCALAPVSQAALAEYYVGRDARQTIPTGPYTGLPNPNFNRLTLLYAHPSEENPVSIHYHAKSTYTYSGPNLGAATAVQPYTGSAEGTRSNFLPEGTTAPLELRPGDGAFAGKLRSGLTPGVEFSDFRLASVDSLAGFAPGTPEHFLFNSGGATPAGRWVGSLTGANLSLVLVGATPGLAVANEAGKTILDAPGESVAIGSGDASLDFLPVLFTSAGAAPGTYSATFKLTDAGTANAGGPWLESGEFTLRTQVVPEPAGLALIGLAGLLGLRRQRADLMRN
jgi:MYXO-CTERM domain-containing protein